MEKNKTNAVAVKLIRRTKAFSFGFEGRMWDLIVSVPDHCLSFHFSHNSVRKCFGFVLCRHFMTLKWLKV